MEQTSSTPASTATRVYDAFGNVASASGTWKSPFSYAGAFGYQEDADSGLKLLGHRYYDSSTGRFLTRDPAKDGRNWYTYCENNPGKYADAEGYVPSWLNRAWNWVIGAASEVGSNTWKFIGVITLVKPIASGLEILYESGVNGEHRRKFDKFLDAAHANGNLSDEKWYQLKKDNNAGAWNDGKNVWARWWEIVWSVK